ncbi:hypothetical protein [Diplocloster hominis]
MVNKNLAGDGSKGIPCPPEVCPYCLPLITQTAFPTTLVRADR